MDIAGPARENLLREQRNNVAARWLDTEVEASELRLRVGALEARCAELEAQLEEATRAASQQRARRQEGRR